MNYLWTAITSTLSQLVILLGPLTFIALAMNYVAGFVERVAFVLMGPRQYLVFFGWLGTVVHELGHTAFCLLFRHKITSLRLFSPDPRTGTLGYVNHRYDPTSIYQQIGNFFIGIGPILFGSLVVYLLARLLLPTDAFAAANGTVIGDEAFSSFSGFGLLLASSWSTAWIVLGEIVSVENLTDWKFYLFVYLSFSVGSSITLSPPDVKGAVHGFWFVVGGMFVLNVLTLWMGTFVTDACVRLTRFYGTLYAVMLFTLSLNVVAGTVFLLLNRLVRRTGASPS